MYFWAREGFVRPAIDLGIALERFLSSPFCCVASQCLDMSISVDFCRFSSYFCRIREPRRAPRPCLRPRAPQRAPTPTCSPPPAARVLSFGRKICGPCVLFCAYRKLLARRAVVLVDCERRFFSLSPARGAAVLVDCERRSFSLSPVRGAAVLVDCLPRFFLPTCARRSGPCGLRAAFLLSPVRGAVVLVDCLPRFPPTRAWRSGPCGLPAAFSCNLCVAQWSSWTACRVILLSRYCFFLSLFSSFFPTLPPPPSSPPLARPACAMDVQKERYDCSQCDQHFRATPRQVDNGWLPNGWRYSRARNLLCQTCSEYHTQGESGEVNIKEMQLAEFAETGRLHCGHCEKETVAVLKSKKGVYRCATCAIDQWAGDKVSRPRYWMEELEKHANEVHNRLVAKEFFDPEGDVRSELLKGTKEYRNSAGQGPEAMALMFHMARVVNRHLDAEP